LTTYWQIAAGGLGREFSNEFLRYGLAFAGTPQRLMLEQVKSGDVLLLKRGLSVIVAVGRAVERGGKCVGYGDKPWLSDFDGWNLPSYCNVEWHLRPQNKYPLDPHNVEGCLSVLKCLLLRPWA